MATIDSMIPKKLPRRRWLVVTAVGVIAICCLVSIVLWNKSASEKFAQQLAESQATTSDTSQRNLVLGTWQDEYQGKRTMTLNEDGTGTMVVELSGWQAAMSASRLKFNMKWAVENGRLKKQTISGEPETQVRMILNMMGDHVDEPILELTEDHLLLLDKDGKTKYDWKRVREK